MCSIVYLCVCFNILIRESMPIKVIFHLLLTNLQKNFKIFGDIVLLLFSDCPRSNQIIAPSTPPFPNLAPYIYSYQK